MEVEAVRRLLQLLESEILDLVEDFERQTDLEITGVAILRVGGRIIRAEANAVFGGHITHAYAPGGEFSSNSL